MTDGSGARREQEAPAMTDPDSNAPAVLPEVSPEAGSEGEPGPPTPVKVVLGLAGAALALLVVAAQRDLNRRPAEQIRGPRRLWKLIAATPNGVALYGLVGIRSPRPPFPSLPEAQVKSPRLRDSLRSR